LPTIVAGKGFKSVNSDATKYLWQSRFKLTIFEYRIFENVQNVTVMKKVQRQIPDEVNVFIWED